MKGYDPIPSPAVHITLPEFVVENRLSPRPQCIVVGYVSPSNIFHISSDIVGLSESIGLAKKSIDTRLLQLNPELALLAFFFCFAFTVLLY
jgi:hypothetical protein